MESHRIIESLEEIEFYSGWESLKQYLSMMESYLEDTRDEFIDWSKEQAEKLTHEQRHEFNDAYIADLVNYYEEFPRILRNSFLISVISLLEYEIGRICHRLINEYPKLNDCSDLRGGVLERFKKYWKKAGLSSSLFNSDPAWDEINKYYLVRNCIVHNKGLIRGARREPGLRPYAIRKKITDEIIIFPEVRSQDHIALTKQFCEEVINNIQTFLREVFEIYESQKQKEHS